MKNIVTRGIVDIHRARFSTIACTLNSTVGRRQRWISGCQFQSLGFPVNPIHVRRNSNLIITRSLLTTSVVSAASREGTTKDNKTRDKGRLLIILFRTLHRTNIIYFWLENIVCQHILFKKNPALWEYLYMYMYVHFIYIKILNGKNHTKVCHQRHTCTSNASGV